MTKTKDFHRGGTEDTEEGMEESELTGQIIGAAIEVHRALGPGLLEAVYEECLAAELSLRGIPFERQRSVAIHYKGKQLDAALRIDLLVNERVVVELKSVDQLLPVHEAQLLTYLRLTSSRVGLLINFNVETLKDGLCRRVLAPSSSSVPSVPPR